MSFVPLQFVLVSFAGRWTGSDLTLGWSQCWWAGLLCPSAPPSQWVSHVFQLPCLLARHHRFGVTLHFQRFRIARAQISFVHCGLSCWPCCAFVSPQNLFLICQDVLHIWKYLVILWDFRQKVGNIYVLGHQSPPPCTSAFFYFLKANAGKKESFKYFRLTVYITHFSIGEKSY